MSPRLLRAPPPISNGARLPRLCRLLSRAGALRPCALLRLAPSRLSLVAVAPGPQIKSSQRVFTYEHPVPCWGARNLGAVEFDRSIDRGGLRAQLKVGAFGCLRLLLALLVVGAWRLARPASGRRRRSRGGHVEMALPSVGPGLLDLLINRCTDYPHPFKTHPNAGSGGAAAGQGQPTG